MYQALYRKYRPKTFDDVVGQEHITETLKKQVETGRLSHAYLFIGTRGTGKTTCAKILAKAVNCEHPVNGNPCNQCAACRGIDQPRRRRACAARRGGVLPRQRKQARLYHRRGAHAQQLGVQRPAENS